MNALLERFHSKHVCKLWLELGILQADFRKACNAPPLNLATADAVEALGKLADADEALGRAHREVDRALRAIEALCENRTSPPMDGDIQVK